MNRGGQAEHESYQPHNATTTPKLSDMGITHSMSSRAQAIAPPERVPVLRPKMVVLPSLPSKILPWTPTAVVARTNPRLFAAEP